MTPVVHFLTGVYVSLWCGTPVKAVKSLPGVCPHASSLRNRTQSAVLFEDVTGCRRLANHHYMSREKRSVRSSQV